MRAEYAELAKEGKYHQLSERILADIEGMESAEANEVYNEIVIPNYHNMCQDSFAEITSWVCNKLSVEDGLMILEIALQLLIASEMKMTGASEKSTKKETKETEKKKSSDTYSSEQHTSTESSDYITQGISLVKKGKTAIVRIVLDIAYKKVIQGDIAMAKIILYDCKAQQIESKEALRKLYLGMGLLHYTTKNYTPAHKNLLEYLQIAEKNEEVYAACLLSGILSDKVYSFAKLISLHTGKKTVELHLAQALEEGNEQEAYAYGNKIGESIGEIAKKKATVIRLLNYFFSNQERVVLLPALAGTLQMDEQKIEEMVLDMLGSSLIKGSIDGLTRTLTYTWMGYKHLTPEEVVSVKRVIETIRKRVDTVQEEIGKRA